MLRRYGGDAPDDTVYLAFNSYWETLSFGLPKPVANLRWHLAVNTAMPPPDDAVEVGQEPLLGDQSCVLLSGRSAMVLVAK